MSTVKSRREEHVDATREALLDSALHLFVERGFSATSLDDVVSAARVTKGALYHHFPGGKQAVFRAVFDRVDEELAERITQSLPADGEGWECVGRGVEAYLDACREPAVRTIIFQEGPVALGWEAWCALGDCPSRALLRATLEVLVSTGDVRPHSLDLLTQVVFGALGEAGRWIGTADDPVRARDEASALVLELLSGLRASGR